MDSAWSKSPRPHGEGTPREAAEGELEGVSFVSFFMLNCLHSCEELFH